MKNSVPESSEISYPVGVSFNDFNFVIDPFGEAICIRNIKRI